MSVRLCRHQVCCTKSDDGIRWNAIRENARKKSVQSAAGEGSRTIPAGVGKRMTEKRYEKIDSHSSQYNNRRLQFLFSEISRLALIASNSLRLYDIHAYYNAVEELYRNCAETISQNIEQIENVRGNYESLRVLIEDYENMRTQRNVRLLLGLTKQFHWEIMRGLQKLQYFFRMGTVNQKGLNSVKFFDDSVFNTKQNEQSDIADATDNSQ